VSATGLPPAGRHFVPTPSSSPAGSSGSESDDLIWHLNKMGIPDHKKWAARIMQAGYADMDELQEADCEDLSKELKMPSGVAKKFSEGMESIRNKSFADSYANPTGDLDSNAPVMAPNAMAWLLTAGAFVATLVVGTFLGMALRGLMVAGGAGAGVGVAVAGTSMVDCLDGDTMITLADRTKKRIKEVKEGDRILSFNHGKLKVKRVLEVKKGSSSNMRCLSVKDTLGKTRVVKATAGHPFFTKKHDWAVLDPDVAQLDKSKPVAKLSIGDALVMRGGKVAEVTKISDVLPRQETFNLVVDGPGVFFAEDILSHSGLPSATKK